MSQKLAESAREAGGPPLPRISLRNVLAIPGFLIVLVLSRSFNLCGAALFAYGTFLVSNPTTLRLLAHRLRREKSVRPLPRQNANGFVGSIDNVIGDEPSDGHDFNEMAVDGASARCSLFQTTVRRNQRAEAGSNHRDSG